MPALQRLVLTALSMLLMVAASAQKRPVYVYGYLSAGGGSAVHTSVGLQVNFLKHHGLSVGYQRYRRKASTIPADLEVSNFIFPGMFPQELLDGASFQYSYYLYGLRPTKAFRFPLSLGLLTGTYSIPGNFHRTTGWGNYYGYDDIASPATAVLVKAGMEFTPTKAFGVHLSVFGVLNRLPAVGVSTGIMLGRTGGWRKGEEW